VTFSHKIKMLIAKELSESMTLPPHECAARNADSLEAIATGVGLCIAMMARGDKDGMSELLEGTTQYIFERAAEFQPMVGFSKVKAPSKKRKKNAPQ
jgi:hypothetical protein